MNPSSVRTALAGVGKEKSKAEVNRLIRDLWPRCKDLPSPVGKLAKLLVTVGVWDYWDESKQRPKVGSALYWRLVDMNLVKRQAKQKKGKRRRKRPISPERFEALQRKYPSQTVMREQEAWWEIDKMRKRRLGFYDIVEEMNRLGIIHEFWTKDDPLWSYTQLVSFYNRRIDRFKPSKQEKLPIPVKAEPKPPRQPIKVVKTEDPREAIEQIAREAIGVGNDFITATPNTGSTGRIQTNAGLSISINGKPLPTDGQLVDVGPVSVVGCAAFQVVDGKLTVNVSMGRDAMAQRLLMAMTGVDVTYND
jgi:hypothetical protein